MSKHSPLYKTRNSYKVGVAFSKVGVVMSLPSRGLVPADNKLTSDWLHFSSFLSKINSDSSSFFFNSSSNGCEATPSTSLPPIGISSSPRSLLLVGVASFIGKILVADSHQTANP